MEKLKKKEPNSLGRPRLFSDVEANRIEELYQMGQSPTIIAEYFECCQPTIVNVLKRRKVYIPHPSKPRKPRDRAHTNGVRTFGNWLKNHPNASRLPRNLKELAYLAGCSYDSVRCYLWTERAKVKRELKKLPELQRYRIPLVDQKKQLYYTNYFKSYSFIIDRFSHQVWLNATLLDTDTATFDVENPALFAKNILDWIRQNTSEKVIPARILETRWVRVNHQVTMAPVGTVDPPPQPEPDAIPALVFRTNSLWP